jgi:hypothetical protein
MQIIQSTKIKNNINSSNENQKEPILKGKMKYFSYLFNFIPLYDFNDNNNKESISETAINKKNDESMDNTISSIQQMPIPILSQYGTKASKKYNAFGEKKNSRNLLSISNNSRHNLKYLRSFSGNKDNKIAKNKKIFSYCAHKLNNNYKNNEVNENEKFKGSIKEKIKEFYKDIKTKGCLSFLSNAQNNTFFMRKYNKKYVSAMKKNFSVKDKIKIGKNTKKNNITNKGIKPE